MRRAASPQLALISHCDRAARPVFPQLLVEDDDVAGHCVPGCVPCVGRFVCACGDGGDACGDVDVVEVVVVVVALVMVVGAEDEGKDENDETRLFFCPY